jgi:hypothetical protein
VWYLVPDRIQEVRVSSRELDLISRSLKGDYSLIRGDFLVSDLSKNSPKFLKSVVDVAKKDKQNYCTLIAIVKN